MNQYFTAEEIAKDLGIPKRTVQNYCRNGFLKASITIYRGRPKYTVSSDVYFQWKSSHFSGLKKGQASKYASKLKEMSLEELRESRDTWLKWCATGKLTGKPLASRTVEIYKLYFDLYLKGLGKYPKKPLISTNNLREVLGSYNPENFSTKRNIYDALMSFTKYLIEIDELDVSDRNRMKTLKPKRYLPARRTSLTESQLNLMIQKIDEINSTDYNRLTIKALVVFLANTGLRASECCRLRLDEVDLENRRIQVNLGKGNKNRIVGMNQETHAILCEYLKQRLNFNSEYFFLNKFGSPFTKDRLTKKISFLAQRAGFKNISPHSLRRSFVTINAAKGKPLNHLRLACGHSDLSTTQSYCMTSVDEVVEAMKSW